MQIPPKILIIDDEPDNFDVIETLLDQENYQLNYVGNGIEALELLANFQPDVILLDIMMPQMNGIEFCQKFKSNPEWKHIPVIIVTALTAKEDLSRCISIGADDFISKPVNGIELRSRVRSMLRIKQQYDALQETLDLREDIAKMIVHDLRNPLSSIVFAAHILQSNNYYQEKQQEKIQEIILATNRLQSMIDSLLLMAKLESGKMILQRTEIDLYAVCFSVLSDMQEIANQKNIELVSYLPELGGSINVDVNLFRRVLDNLLSNAMKFSPKNSKIILQADYLQSGGAKIQVADFGPGVTEELRQTIFEKYEVGTLMKDVSQIGLGLAFCKMTVEAHGGKISVVSNTPQGSIFIIEI